VCVLAVPSQKKPGDGLSPRRDTHEAAPPSNNNTTFRLLPLHVNQTDFSLFDTKIIVANTSFVPKSAFGSSSTSS
jgi:hypothetical protein